MLFSHCFYPIILGDTVGGGDIDSPLLRMVYILIYFVTLGLLAFRWQRTLTFITSNKWLLFVIGLSIVSISWSAVPHISFRKVIAVMGASMFGLYLGSRYDFLEQLKIYRWAYGIALISSYVFALALPQYGIMNTDAIVGAWRGIFPHKNGLGESIFVGFMAFYFSASITKDPQRRKIYQVFGLLSVLLIYFAESATSLMSVFFIFFAAQSLNRLSLKSKKSVLLVLVFLIASCFMLFFFVSYFETFLRVNNRDITLSGRTELWDTLWQFIRDKPWLGYGYGSFFSGESREANLLWQIHDWSPVHAHNGYVQLVLHIGLIGCSIFILGYLFCMFDALFKYLTSKDLRMLWIFLFLIYTIFTNLTEVSFFSTNNIWVLALASLYSMNNRTRTKIKPKAIASTN